MRITTHAGLFALSLFLVLGHYQEVAADEYFLLMFASQRVPANPNYAHTFATFVKVSPTGAPPTMLCEAHTISWLPANMKVRTNALRPEEGHNFDLRETLGGAYATKQRVSLWGPYRIDPELYERSLSRKTELESGSVRYKADDSFRRDDRVSNCIHAVSAITQGRRVVVTSPGWGQSASFIVLKEVEPWVLSKEPVEWVGSALGLDCYPIIYRDWRNPLSGGILGPVFRALGSERGIEATYGPPAR